MATRIAVRRDTAANWALANPILAPGEPALETDTQIIKYGDGVRHYANLPLPKADGSSQISLFGKINVPISTDFTQAAIQDLINSNPAGTRFSFAPGTYALEGPLVLPNNNTVIDAAVSTFTQVTWGQPGFDAIGRNGCLFDIGMVQFVGDRPPAGSNPGQAASGTAYRGSAPYCSGAGIWLNGDRNYVRRLRTSGMPVGVFLSSWAGSGVYERIGVGNRIDYLETDTYDFGILYVMQDGLVVNEVYGHDDFDDSAGGNPTHVVYGSADTAFRATGGSFRHVRAKNHLYGQPFQTKFHDKLHVGRVSAENSRGLINVMDSNDLVIDSYSGLGILANGGQGAITFQRSVTNSQRPRMGAGYIQLAASVDERVINVISDNGIFDRITLDTSHSGAASPANTPAEIVVRGAANRFVKPILRSTGAGSVPGFWIGFGEVANNTIVDQPQVSGTSSVAKIDQATGAVVDFDPILQSITGTVYVTTVTTGAIQRNPTPLTPYQFGAIDPIVGADNTVALAAMFAAAAGSTYTGATIYMPPGFWKTTAPLPLFSNMVIRGAGRKTRFVAVGTNNLFEWNSSLASVNMADMWLECANAGKAIFAPGAAGGINASTFKQLFLYASNDTSQIWQQVNGASFIGNTFQDCEMQRTVGATVAPFNIINSGGAANFNVFNMIRLDGAMNVTTPFFHLESTLVGTYMTDWTFENILGEQNPGGIIQVLAADNWKLTNVTDEDSTVDYVANIIEFKQNGLALGSRSILIENSGRRGRAMVGGKFDISCDPATSREITMINCNPTPVSQTALLAYPVGSVILGTRGYPNGKQGSGTPETFVNGVVGDHYFRTDGGAGTSFYVKESGSAATGWVAK